MMCQDKVRYSDKAQAYLVLQRREPQTKGGRLYVYQCPTCNGWHLTKRRNMPAPRSPKSRGKW